MKKRRLGILLIVCATSLSCGSEKSETPEGSGLLIPDLDNSRRERLEIIHGRYVTPEGFEVEEVMGADRLGSIINMTFDPDGRPALSTEEGGILLLLDEDDDGKPETVREFTSEVQRAQGMHYLGPGDLLVQANGAQGLGLYRLRDADGDDRAEQVEFVIASRGNLASEHGPHAIVQGPDGFLYFLYGNHSSPTVALDVNSPSRDLGEDHLLPRYVDPRGHAALIRAPAGTIFRADPDLEQWSQIAGGFRNPYDLAIDAAGEVFVFEADMEWDVGLPWFRPVRVLHVVPGGDYGWRTGSSKFQPYYLDTLPSVDAVGRGSPVGIAFYQHHVYPERFHGALFMGDWARGRIRVIFPEPAGASYSGETIDFLLGEPLNVTDLDIGPDGLLYFSTGGRLTRGGLYRVRYKGQSHQPDLNGTNKILNQPMPRSAWGRKSLAQAKERMGSGWQKDLTAVLMDGEQSSSKRLRALEGLQILGPNPSLDSLVQLIADRDPRIRMASIFLLGTYPLEAAGAVLVKSLSDLEPAVVRRACEALVRAGLDPSTAAKWVGGLDQRLMALLEHEDRFVRYAARMTLTRIDREAWATDVLNTSSPRKTVEGLLALIYTQSSIEEANQIFNRLEQLEPAELTESVYLDYLRVLQLALVRDPGADDAVTREGFKRRIGERLLAGFPHSDRLVNRELQILLAYLHPSGAIAKLLRYLAANETQEQQVQTIYCLRAIQQEWTKEQRAQLLEWFYEVGWHFRGGVSMGGYLDNLWESSLEILPEDERKIAENRQDEFLRERARKAMELTAETTEEDGRAKALLHMSFQELSEYFEYDPTSYEEGDPEEGRKVFYRVKCVNCHIFGVEGTGGGPDLTTVVKRFRRSEILESIMYPSKVISDQYTALRVRVEGPEGQEEINGMLAGENDTILTLITAAGDRVEIPKQQIALRAESDVSIMPEGLLDAMSVQDLINLFVFLERSPE